MRPVPVVVVHVEQARPPSHADDVDEPVDGAELLLGERAETGRVGTLGDVARPRHADADLLRDVRGARLVDVDTDDARRARLRERMTGLTAHALAGADHHVVATVEAQAPGVVGHC